MYDVLVHARKILTILQSGGKIGKFSSVSDCEMRHWVKTRPCFSELARQVLIIGM